jgi:hypothetical protein
MQLSSGPALHDEHLQLGSGPILHDAHVLADCSHMQLSSGPVLHDELFLAAYALVLCLLRIPSQARGIHCVQNNKQYCDKSLCLASKVVGLIAMECFKKIDPT